VTESLRFAKNLGFLYSTEIVSHIIGFVVSVYIARVLGGEYFGQISFSLALLSYFILFTNFGLVTYGIKEVSHNVKTTVDITSTLILVQAVFSIIAYGIIIVLVLIAWQQFPPEKKYLILILGLSLFPTVFDLTWVFIAHERMQYRAFVYFMRYITYALMIFLLLPRYTTIITIGIAYFTATLIVALLSTAAYLKLFRSFLFAQSDLVSHLKVFLKGALPIGWATLMSRIYYNFDTLMLSFMQGDLIVGWYNAAYRIILVLTSIGGIYGMVYLPALSKRIRTSKQAAKSLIERSFRILVSFILPITAGGILLSPKIIVFVFGEQYRNASEPFRVLLIAVFIIFISVVFSYGLIGLGKQKQLAIYSTIAALLNVGLNFLFIPMYGTVGAAITTVISEVTVFIGVFFTFRKEMMIPSLSLFLKPLIASASMVTAIILLNNSNLVILIVIGILVYLGVIYTIGGISKSELILIKEMVRRK